MSIRRQIRQRKEYLYLKSLEGNERKLQEKKRKLKQALEEGHGIPTELKPVASDLRHQIELEDEKTKDPRSSVDNEYAFAGIRDPRICLTTSRDPSNRLQQFAKEMRLIFPTAERINRGATKVRELVDICRQNDFTDLIVLHETRGEPDGLVVCHLPFGPTAFFTLSGAVLRHDIENRATMSEAYPHLIFHDFTTPLGERASNILKYLFPIPKSDSKRVITFANNNDFISFRHHVYKKEGKEVVLSEVGPRFEMQLYQIRLGTLEQA